MITAADYIEALQAEGRFSFTTDEAVAALGVSVPAARAAVRRLKARGAVVAPYKGFHVVVPPAYRRTGCLPAEQFVPDFMQYLGEPYYVGLLSAARYHGAAHQAPMVFQVIVPTSRRGLARGSVRVGFIARHDMEETSVVERNTPAGSIRVATAAATALEVVGYPQHCGYLDNVLAELAESVDERSEPMPGLIVVASVAGGIIGAVLDDLQVLIEAGEEADFANQVPVRASVSWRPPVQASSRRSN